MAAPHTPGPWSIAGSGYGLDVRCAAGNIVGMTRRFGQNPAEVEANARLVAAAPDLLAALREALRFTPDVGVAAARAVSNAQAAIAKAEGAGR